jgi:hypothetical protein
VGLDNYDNDDESLGGLCIHGTEKHLRFERQKRQYSSGIWEIGKDLERRLSRTLGGRISS